MGNVSPKLTPRVEDHFEKRHAQLLGRLRVVEEALRLLANRMAYAEAEERADLVREVRRQTQRAEETRGAVKRQMPVCRRGIGKPPPAPTAPRTPVPPSRLP